jgi:hypothetical protein
MTRRRDPLAPPEGNPASPEEAAARLADQYLFRPARPPQRPAPAPAPADGWARTLRNDRESGRTLREVFPVERHGVTADPAPLDR